MPGAFLSIVGMYNFDNTIFDNLTIPESLDRDTVIETIMLDNGNRGLLYLDFDFMKKAIGTWSKRNALSWQRAAAAVNISYNPLENYDRKECWTDSAEAASTSSGSGTNSGSTKASSTGFNTGEFRDTDKGESSGQTASSDNSSGTSKSKHRGRVHGNVGVTTSQQMLAAELDLAPRLDVYRRISEDFAMQFCYSW